MYVCWRFVSIPTKRKRAQTHVRVYVGWWLKLGCCNVPPPPPVTTVRYRGKWVAEVSLMLGNGNIIRKFLNSEAMLIKVQRYRARVRKIRTQTRRADGTVPGECLPGRVCLYHCLSLF